MKSIILSIQPQWLTKILNGEKTIEIRKSAPKELPCEIYLYCTRSKPELYTASWQIPGRAYQNGKVVAKFTLKNYGCSTDIDLFDEDAIYRLVEHSCVPFADIIKYANKKPFYIWQIENLVIFEKPMELGKFRSYTTRYCDITKNMQLDFWPLTRAPQSWQYCEPIK